MSVVMSEGRAAAVHDEKQIRAVIERYFDALYYGDATAFRQVLHPHIQLNSTAAGELVNFDLEAHMQLVEGRPSPASRKDPRDDQIVSVTVASPTTAHARARDMYLPKRFLDESKPRPDSSG